MLIVITKQLSRFLPQNHSLQKKQAINPANFNETFNMLKLNAGQHLCAYDLTISKNLKSNQIIMIKDHINKTGSNILTGKQKALNIDFVDQTNIYKKDNNSIVTTCLGDELNQNIDYSSHYICHLTTLAKALKYKTITAYLVNGYEHKRI